MEVGFNDFHIAVTKAIGIGENPRLKEIGCWFWRFMESECSELILTLPEYDSEFVNISWKYIRVLSILIELSNENSPCPDQNTGLFDFFRPRPKMQLDEPLDYIIHFDHSKLNIDRWQNGILTGRQKFLPFFKIDQIRTFNDSQGIHNSFEIFKAIRQVDLFKKPRLIDLESPKILTLSCIESNDYIKEILLFVDGKMDEDEAADLEKQLKQENISLQLQLIFPYARRAHSYLREVSRKRFSLKFNSRFFCDPNSEDELNLYPGEKEGVDIRLWKYDNFTVFDTNHNLQLYSLLQTLKEDWKCLELNRFEVPFPKYWLMCINQGRAKQWWIERFSIDYPSLVDRPIIKHFEQIISELHDLNWIEKFFQENDVQKILLPKLVGRSGDKLRVIMTELRSYAMILKDSLEFVTETSIHWKDSEPIYLFNGFSIIDQTNLHLSNTRFQIIIPDFIFYSYQPWVKYHTIRFHWSSIIGSARSILDPNYSKHIDQYKALKENTIQEIKGLVKGYNSKYLKKKLVLQEEEYDSTDYDDEYRNEEEIVEIQKNDKRAEARIIQIKSNIHGEIDLKSTSKVYIKRNSIIEAKAENLKVGDQFLLKSDLDKLIDEGDILEKYSEISESIRNYQTRLAEYPELYTQLNRRGISYSHKQYFEQRYIIEKDSMTDEAFVIPKRKNDWKIICDFLGIDEAEMNLAFIAYYGRTKKNRITELYQEIISFFIENEFFGMSENPEILIQTNKIISTYEDIFPGKETAELSEISESIISTIFSELEFAEVQIF